MFLYRNSELLGEFATLKEAISQMFDSEEMMDTLDFPLLDSGERLFDLPYQEREYMDFQYTICDDGTLEVRLEPDPSRDPLYIAADGLGLLLRAARGDPDALKQIIGDN